MSKILKVKNVSDYVNVVGGNTYNPLVAIVDFATLSPVPHSLNDYDVYGVFMHKHLSVDLTYGCGKYDYTSGGTIICVAPGQIGGKEDNGERIDLDGWALLFHPDFIRNTELGKTISRYSFFDYNINEALHTSSEEFDILSGLMKRIESELSGRCDDLQNAIVYSYISLVLNYCKRFYDRQFMMRKIENADILHHFRELLVEYYNAGMQFKYGLPTVNYCAEKLCMSPGYFGDVVKKYTGDSAISYIHRFVINKAKNELSSGEAVSAVAYDLGFDFPGHLSRLFRKKEGISPSDYVKGKS